MKLERVYRSHREAHVYVFILGIDIQSVRRDAFNAFIQLLEDSA